MTPLFHRLNLHTKVSLLILATTVSTLAMLAGSFTAFELFRHRKSLVHELSALMDTIGSNTTAALRFDDRRTGAENLEALRADPRVIAAAVYDKSGRLFAEFRQGRRQEQFHPAEATGARFEDSTLLIVRDIRLDGDLLGRMFLRADSAHLRQRIQQYALLSLLILTVSVVFGYLISRRLLGILIRPILALTEAARTVMQTATYDVRLERMSGDEVGELTDCFGAMMSQIRQRDRELNLHREHLEEQVRVRTAELEAARRKAEEAARLKSEFLANMSHEIRTPLNGMMGLTALSLETALPPEAREYLELANYSADTLLAVINDILDFSKIESGKLTMESVPFHLPRLVSRQVRLLALQAHRKNLELVCEIAPEVPTMVVGDPTRLQQVLGNLVGNAIKFTPAGEVVVSVSLAGQSAEGVRIRFRVSDTGIGIAPEAQALIFDAFTQADGSTTRRFGGTGLGLAISKRLVERMHGDLTLTSAPDAGSTFEFQVLLGAAAWEPEPSSATEASLAGMRVLVVDDHPVNRRVFVAYAMRLGMKAEQASGAAEALTLALAAARSGRPFDVIYCDRQMPGIDGFGFVRQLRSTPEITRTPVLMLSSLDALEDASLCRELGLEHHLVKPVLFDDLRELTWRALQGSPGLQAAPTPAARLSPTTRSLRILVAEDNMVNQRVIQRTLQKMGHDVVLVGNGRLAVERAGDGFDAILMDCQMPEMDGFEASRRIRSAYSAAVRSLPIIALTAFALEGDRDRCLAAGMTDYVRKPLDIRELSAKLQQIADSRTALAKVR